MNAFAPTSMHATHWEIRMGKQVLELEGAELDYWVGKAAKLNIGFDSDMTIQNRQVLYIKTKPWNGADMPSMDRYSPSQWWHQGGPLIEKHGIVVERIITAGDVTLHYQARKYPRQTTGPTYLIAAMRALVASVYGDEVGEAHGPDTKI